MKSCTSYDTGKRDLSIVSFLGDGLECFCYVEFAGDVTSLIWGREIGLFTQLGKTRPFGFSWRRKDVETCNMTTRLDNSIGQRHTETSATTGDSNGFPYRERRQGAVGLGRACCSSVFKGEMGGSVQFVEEGVIMSDRLRCSLEKRKAKDKNEV